MWSAGNATLSHPDIMQHAAGIGHISARNEEGNPQNDGVYRQQALVVNYEGKIFPSLSLRAAIEYLRVPPKNIKITHSEIALSQAMFPDTGDIKDIHIPINDQGEMWVYFPGQWQDNYFEPFWFESTLANHQDQARWPEYDQKFTGSICFVGNASGKNKDIHVIPTEDNFPGVGIHAAALFTILSGNFIYFPGPLTTILIIIGLSLLAGFVSCYKPPISAALTHSLMLLTYVLFTFWIFGQHRISLPTLFPSLTILLSVAAALGYHFFQERQDKENLLKEYNMIQSSLEFKDQRIQHLTSIQDKTSQLTEEQAKELAKNKEERLELIKKIRKLEVSLDKTKLNLDNTKAEVKGLIRSVHRDETLEKDWEQLRRECRQAGIITANKQMLEIFDMVKSAAGTKTSVLILGESGTGKELVARAIHYSSKQADKPFIDINCANLSETLLESELFGHLKGAFTGADRDKIGKFELADGGTLFLDEVGDMTPAIQCKLLRVLQEREFEKVGGTAKIRVDVRVIAATHRDLKEMIAQNKFRLDLYYRLNVLPINLSALRERKEDIEPLAKHFIEKYSRKAEGQTPSLTEQAAAALKSYNWPGNIRELENVIERAVVLTKGDLITEADLRLNPSIVGSLPITNISSNESLFSDNYEDIGFLELLNKNDFEINKTAADMGKQRGAITERFKGVCLKALAENDWDVARTAKAITSDPKNLEPAQAKVKEYYDNTLEKLGSCSSSEQLEAEVKIQFKNMPKRFHRYILELYEAKRK
ncbi:MAG: sigma 54-interacting transcriptional regulator [Candidatus Schekmanbacteria bacterium]|nr:sigma 54-interacting transcriptional regulator [Candidatus Schekmanbacteria bacterium]